MKDEIKEILDKFDKVLENYELDKKFGQMSVDSICHLFPSEMVAIKDCITNLQEEIEKLKETNVYCNRTDCSGRIKDSRKYDSVYQEKEDYKSRCEKAIEELDKYINSCEIEAEHTLNNEKCLISINHSKKVKNILNGGDDNE